MRGTDSKIVDVVEKKRSSLKKLFSSEVFTEAGRRFVQQAADYLNRCQQSPAPVFPLATRNDLLASAQQALDASATQSMLHKPTTTVAANRFSELCTVFLKNSQHIHSPHYMGHQVPPPIPIAALFDALTGFTNQGLAVHEMGPFASAAERALVMKLGALVGWAPGYDGFATGGGTLANLTAILAARGKRYGSTWAKGVMSSGKRPAVIASVDAHYSISRAAGVLGIGTENVIKAPVDAQRKMQAAALPEILARAEAAGQDVFCIVASAPATPIGAFDPLPAVAAVAKANGVWLHVDGAHGASVLFSETHRHLVAGIELADSVTWDAHKMLFVPSLSTFLLFREKSDSYQSFQQEAPYLFDQLRPDDADFEGGLRTLECTKRGVAVGLWGLWSLYGSEIFADLVDVTFANARGFFQLLAGEADFAAVHQPECNIICFRHLPGALASQPADEISAHQLRIRDALQRSGRFYVTITKIEGVAALRLTLINPLTTMHHLEELLTCIRTAC